tara:strand:+ start:212 stop:949 length:738 start_codon:yes stop_codon:yes gene_type:complete
MQMRLDKALVDRGLASTRSRAQFMIRSRVILINGNIVDKVSFLLKTIDVIRIVREINPWVSRAALKLEHAINVFELAPLSGVAMDIGASTGGFTEVLLAYGCSKVYAIDVGKGQLDSKLKNDCRILNFEGVNAKDLGTLDLPLVDIIVCDASFISFSKVVKVPLSFGKDNCQLIGLIKPQFEVGPKKVGKRGIVRDVRYQEEACLSVKSFLYEQGWFVTHLQECPIYGSDGNHEYLIAAKKIITK